MSEPKKVGRRTFLNYATAIVATGVIVGAATYLATPKGATTTVTVPAATTTVTVPGAATTVTAPGATTTVTAPGGTATGKPIPSEPIKIGILTFFSGSNAVVDVQIWWAAQMLAEKINSEGGILGRKIELVQMDVGPNTDTCVQNYRKLVLENHVDLVTGDLASSNGLAVAPICEELKCPTIYLSTTTTHIFEDVDPKPKYLFRAGNYNTMEAVSCALHIKRHHPDVKRVAGINPDYAYGRDSWQMFVAALQKLLPQVEVVYEAWPPLGTTDFTSHITATLNAKPDVVFSVLYASDIVAFMKQAVGYGFFKQVPLFYNALGYISFNMLTKDVCPEGLYFQARDYYFLWPPAEIWPIQGWFVPEFYNRWKQYPNIDAGQLYSAIDAYKRAVEKVYALTGEYPTNEQIVEAMAGSSCVGPMGYRTIRREDHQFLSPAPIGKSKHSPDYPFVILDELEFIQPEECAAPPGVKSLDWIKSWKI
jgi:branched-chain amino acid transport system substrate-binding protein